jgi:hypothetical protein
LVVRLPRALLKALRADCSLVRAVDVLWAWVDWLLSRVCVPDT